MDNISEFINANIGLVFALGVIVALLARNLIMPARIHPLDTMSAIRLMNQENALVLDVRGNDEYQKGHILNSMHIPLALLDSKQSEISAFKSEQIILICRSGNRSYQAGLTLKKLGFENLHNLKGGVVAWEQAGLPLTTKPTKVKHKPKPKKKEPQITSENNSDSGGNSDSSSVEAKSNESDDTDMISSENLRETEAVSAGNDEVNSGNEKREVSENIENNGDNKEVVVYTTKQCPFCDRAVNLLSKKGIGYTEINIDGKPQLREEMEKKSMRKSAPQIFVGETHVGGFDDMYMLESEGRLNTVFGVST